MRIYLDDQPIASKSGTLTGALAAVAEHVGDRLVVEARADGRVLSPDELTAPAATDPFAQELRFRTADPIDLARVTLHDAGVAVGELEGAHAETADLIEAGSTEKMSSALSAIFATWSQTLSAIEIISRTPGMPWPPAGAGVDQAAIDGASGELRACLDQIKTALTAGDWAGLCDILRYDMDQQAASWKRLCNNLADALARGAR